jgi:hypothetical protein
MTLWFERVVAHDLNAVHVSISPVCCSTYHTTGLTYLPQVEQNVQSAVDNVQQVLNCSQKHADRFCFVQTVVVCLIIARQLSFVLAIFAILCVRTQRLALLLHDARA